jgi:hypothetical protein
MIIASDDSEYITFVKARLHEQAGDAGAVVLVMLVD